MLKDTMVSFVNLWLTG